MDEALKAYLDAQFGALTQHVDGLTQRVEALEVGQREMRTLLEARGQEIRSIAESHQILYEGMTRREENLRAEMRELQRLLMIWGDSSSRRLAAVEELVARLTAGAPT